MENKFIEESLIVGITILFLVSAINPLVTGYVFKTIDRESLDEDYFFDRCEACPQPDSFCSEIQFSRTNSNDDLNLNEKRKEESLETINGGLQNSSWPMKCHDLRHTAQSPYSTADNPGIEKWRFLTEDCIEAPPIIGNDGTIYVGDFDRYVYAIHPNGTLKWEYHTGGWIWSAPAIAEDGTLYVGSMDDYLYALNPNGTRKWRFCADGSITSSPAIADDGTIYFGAMGPGDDGRINAVNPNGTQKWYYDTGYWICSSPAVGDDGTIYIGSGDKHLYALYPNGTLRWRYKTEDWVKSHPSIAEDGTIYIASFDHNLYALNPNGTLKWKRGSDYSGCSSVGIGEDGTLYFGSLYAAYPNNGTTKWHIDLPDVDHSSPAISSDGTIYVCADASLIAVDQNGTEMWRERIGKAQSSPAIAKDGTIYVGSAQENAGFLHAFGALDPNAPYEPSIVGPTEGTVGEEYEYTFMTEDPNGDDIYYYIEWGDKTYEYKIGPYESGEEITLAHKWKEEGTYTIRARGIDTHNLWGPWGEMDVDMPVNQETTAYPLFWWFLERFPLLKLLFQRWFYWILCEVQSLPLLCTYASRKKGFLPEDSVGKRVLIFNKQYRNDK